MSTASKPVVVIESPYAGDIEKNLRYVRACLRDSILRGECPLASHALYTQPGVLRDEVHEERELGMGLGWHVMKRADFVAVYTDLGWSSGMVRGYNASVPALKGYEIRRLGWPWSESQPGVDYVRVGVPDNYWRTDVFMDGVAVPDAVEVDTRLGFVARFTPHSVPNIEVIKSDKLTLKLREKGF